jgi:hypothetical protein
VPLARHEAVRAFHDILERERANEATQGAKPAEALEQPHDRRAARYQASIRLDEVPALEPLLLGHGRHERGDGLGVERKESELSAPVEPGDDPRRPAAEPSVAVVEHDRATKLAIRHACIVGSTTAPCAGVRVGGAGPGA